MSGICGSWSFNGGNPDLGPILAHLERRGPDGTNSWHDGPVALGHTLLATTPEALVEVLPLTEPDSGCTITADARLDNREELIGALEMDGETRVIGDGELILRAYLKWGEESPKHLLGDFAFAIWDPRKPRLFCARDHMGMRQLIYYHVPGRLFAFATEADALVAHPAIPKRINQGRIADFLDDLEGLDLTSTFFERVLRLPPAHVLSVGPKGVSLRRYWELSPGPELKLESDQAYADAFLTVFTEAVRCRLRSAGPVGSMLSGGLDSNAVVSVASGFLAADGRGPLTTVSAVGPNPFACAETRAIDLAVAAPGIVPIRVDHAATGVVDRELLDLTRASAEPFDGHMTLIRAVYRAAHRSGLKVMLDGVGGDVVLTAGNRVASLLRHGRVRKALAEARAEGHFWGSKYRLTKELSSSIWTAWAPDWLREARHKLIVRWKDFGARSENRKMSGAFGRSVDLKARRARFRNLAGRRLPFGADYRAMSIAHTHLVLGRERYDRVAAQFGIEPRDPFLDIRLIAFCLSLPDCQVQNGGWPKMIVRRAMSDTLPDGLIWRRGKEHLGWTFSDVLLRLWSTEAPVVADETALLDPYIADVGTAPELQDKFKSIDRERLFALRVLACWLRCNLPSRESLARDGE